MRQAAIRADTQTIRLLLPIYFLALIFSADLLPYLTDIVGIFKALFTVIVSAALINAKYNYSVLKYPVNIPPEDMWNMYVFAGMTLQGCVFVIPLIGCKYYKTFIADNN